MKIETQEIERRLDRFKKICRDSRAKLTHQRLEIFREVAQTDAHPDVESVFKGVRERIPTVSLDTVYRTLWWLEELGLIATLGPPRERTRFDANLNNHHHFVCSSCGLTRDFYSDHLDKLNISDLVEFIGHAETTQVEIKGVCHACAVKKEKTKFKRL